MPPSADDVKSGASDTPGQKASIDERDDGILVPVDDEGRLGQPVQPGVAGPSGGRI